MAEAMSINVSTQELRTLAGHIRTRKTTLRTKLDDIKKQMENLNQTWTSEASTEILRSMRNTEEKFFDEYDGVIESYANFLVTAAEQYEETESTAKKNASEFQ